MIVVTYLLSHSWLANLTDVTLAIEDTDEDDEDDEEDLTDVTLVSDDSAGKMYNFPTGTKFGR